MGPQSHGPLHLLWFLSHWMAKLIQWNNILVHMTHAWLFVDTYILLFSHAVFTVIRIAVFDSGVYSIVSSALTFSGNEGSGLTSIQALRPVALSSKIEKLIAEFTVSWVICGIRYWMNVAVTVGQMDSWGWQLNLQWMRIYTDLSTFCAHYHQWFSVQQLIKHSSYNRWRSTEGHQPERES